jgi:hypothetical protein
MTTAVQQQRQNGLGSFTGLILLLLAIIAPVIFLNLLDGQTLTLAAVRPIPEIKYQPHSVERHGTDALAIRACYALLGG